MYYLIDDKITSPRLGDVPVQKIKGSKGGTGERFVVMNAKQAEYWIDQGAIAEEAPKTATAEVVHDQMIGEGDQHIKKAPAAKR
jgi:hypothetical protein